jgi:hypothetical protein
MKPEKNGFKGISLWVITLFLALLFSMGCTAQKAVEISDEEVENLVRRSYQYVAMYNVIQRFALDPASAGLFMDGFNKPKASTALADHNMRSIARPNNDTLYQGAVLDLRLDPVIIEFPAIDSKYAVLQTSGYDHYPDVPLASSKGDFKIPTRVLFYTDRTEGYNGEEIKGIDLIVKADGDFFLAFLRAMPHQADPARMKRIIRALESVKVVTLSEYRGKSAKDYSGLDFPAYGKSDADIFADNLFEVMQFIFNHTTFDPDNDMDRALLAAYRPFGIEPGKTFDGTKVAGLKGPRLRKVANQVAKQALVDTRNPEFLAKGAHMVFMPKGRIDLDTQVAQSVTGPIGLPAYQARYLPVSAKDGKPMNARHDYVLKMSKDELPPATAFWSLTLYDQANGFFIPNDQKKYSVGENTGYKLDDEGGIEIFISAKKPEGVPSENWLPINRGDMELSLMYRIYVPDSEKMKTWKTPQPEVLLSMGSVESDVSPEQARAIAKEAYIYGFPMVMAYKTIYNYAVDKENPEYKGPFNKLSCVARLFTPQDKGIVTPNADTPYCMFWIDLRAEPMVLTVPEMEPGRLYSFQLIDLYTHNFAYVGTLTSGNGAGKFLIAGPDWNGEKPRGISDVLRSETGFVFNITRTQLFGPGDLANVKEIQDSYGLQPLSAFLGTEAPVAKEMPEFPRWVEGAQFDERSFGYLDFMMSLLAEPAQGEKRLWDRIARLGLGQGNTFDFAALTTQTRDALKEGVKEAFGEMEQFIAEAGSDPLASAKVFGTREFLQKSAKENYGHENHYLLRAAAGHMGLYGNSAAEAIYPAYLADSDGQPYDASANRYTISFEKRQLPPVRAFWSLTMYDAKTQLLIENPLERYLLNSSMMDQFRMEADGSLVLHIEKDSPGGGLESNWLPAPDGPFYMVLRLYGPEPKALDGKWTPPVLQKVN